jgi:uncharacterized protein (TIGR00255 family)
MPLASMTGFARAPFEAGGVQYWWELKSVNARGLEIRARLPAGFEHLEVEMRALARQRLTWGSCFFGLQADAGPNGARLSLDQDALALVVAAARRLAAEDGIAMPSADGLLAIPGVLREGPPRPAGDDAGRFDAAALRAFDAGLAAIASARAEEGARIQQVLKGQFAAVEELVAQGAAIAAEAPETLKARIREQVDLLLADRTAFDAERLHQEAVLLATRGDVREELDRLRSHVAGGRDLLARGGAVGRRLEFLAQEFNREANTLGAKAFDRRLTAVSMELKTVIDQFREQVQNIE